MAGRAVEVRRLVAEGGGATGCGSARKGARSRITRSGRTWSPSVRVAGPAEGTFLIDASGQVNFTGNREGLREANPKLRKIAIFAHFGGIPLPEGERRGDIIIVRLEHEWAWIIPLSEEKVSVGLVIDQARFKASGLTPAEMFERLVESSSVLRGKWSGAERISPLRTISDYSYKNRRFVGPRLIRAGDAAGSMDPIFSSGVHVAMESGHAAANVVDDALARGPAFTPRFPKLREVAARGHGSVSRNDRAFLHAAVYRSLRRAPPVSADPERDQRHPGGAARPQMENSLAHARLLFAGQTAGALPSDRAGQVFLTDAATPPCRRMGRRRARAGVCRSRPLADHARCRHHPALARRHEGNRGLPALSEEFRARRRTDHHARREVGRGGRGSGGSVAGTAGGRPAAVRAAGGLAVADRIGVAWDDGVSGLGTAEPGAGEIRGARTNARPRTARHHARCGARNARHFARCH